MPSLNGITAWLHSPEGVALDEYRVEVKGNIVTAYVEAVEGKEWQLTYRRDMPYMPACRGRLSIDGQDTCGMISRKDKPCHITGVSIDNNTEQPFAFAALKTVEDDEAGILDERTLKALGSIELNIRRITTSGRAGHGREAAAFQGSTAISERSKKAQLSNSVALGAIRQATSHRITYTDIDHAPYVVFRFLYRSRALLEAEGIIEPLPAAPVITQEASPSVTPSVAPADPPNSKGKRRAEIDLTQAVEVKPNRSKRVKAEQSSEPIDVEAEALAAMIDQKPMLPDMKLRVLDDGVIDLT